jgi:hypothetical protein
MLLSEAQRKELEATGKITLTKEQLDESFRESYWRHAVEYSLQYYIAGRFSIAAQLTPVCATLLHHAVELMLKACLAYEDDADTIRRYGNKRSYGHKLSGLWQEFGRRNTDLDLTGYASTIEALDAFEDIRYPDRLVDQGAMISVGLHETPPPNTSARPERSYVLGLPEVDRLMSLLFEATGINGQIFEGLLGQQHASVYHLLHNAAPLV